MKFLFLISSILVLSGCSGLTQTEDRFSTHAESFNVLFLQIPGNTMERANNLVPENAEVETVYATPSDTKSVTGVLNRLIGVEQVSLSGNIQDKN